MALDVDARAIPPVRPRLGGEGQGGEPADHLLQVAGPEARLGIAGADVEAGGMAHQLGHGHGRGLGDEAPVRRLYLQARELGYMPGDGIVQLPEPLLPELHHGDPDHRLGHGGDAPDRVRPGRGTGLDIGEAPGLEVDHLPLSRGQGGDPGQLPLVHQGLQVVGKGLQPGRIEAGGPGVRERQGGGGGQGPSRETGGEDG